MSGAQSGREVRIYTDSEKHRFAVRHLDGAGLTEFHSLPEAIRFVTHLPHDGPMTIVLHDENGKPLTEMPLRCC